MHLTRRCNFFSRHNFLAWKSCWRFLNRLWVWGNKTFFIGWSMIALLGTWIFRFFRVPCTFSNRVLLHGERFPFRNITLIIGAGYNLWWHRIVVIVRWFSVVLSRQIMVTMYEVVSSFSMNRFWSIQKIYRVPLVAVLLGLGSSTTALDVKNFWAGFS